MMASSIANEKRVRAHAKQVHVCRCGRMILGNAYYAHFKVCPATCVVRDEIQKQRAALRAGLT